MNILRIGIIGSILGFVILFVGFILSEEEGLLRFPDEYTWIRYLANSLMILGGYALFLCSILAALAAVGLYRMKIQQTTVVGIIFGFGILFVGIILLSTSEELLYDEYTWIRYLANSLMILGRSALIISPILVLVGPIQLLYRLYRRIFRRSRLDDDSE